MPSNDKQYAAGIDIGGTKTMVGIVHASGRIAVQSEFPTLPAEGPGRLLDTIALAVRRLAAEADVDPGRLRGSGIAAAGLLDAGAGELLYARNLGWRNVRLAAELTERLALPVRLGNDANLAAVAEYVWGTGRKAKDLIYITVSTGIGAGIISGGRLVEGGSGRAGEFGHITAAADGPRCACGNYGCLENYSSGTAIAAIARARLREPQHAPYLADFNPETVTARELVAAAEAGHPFARPLVETAGFNLGCGIVTLIHLFNPQAVILGGSVAAGGNVLFDAAKRAVEERCMPDMRRGVLMRRTNLGKAIGVLGAAGLFFMGDEGDLETGGMPS